MLLQSAMLSVLILLLSFLEIIVFNEEVLLALCFISFVLFAYNFLNVTVFTIFLDRANKFETDLLQALHVKFEGVKKDASAYKLSTLLLTKLQILEIQVTSYSAFLHSSSTLE